MSCYTGAGSHDLTALQRDFVHDYQVEAAKRERIVVEQQSERAIDAMKTNIKRSQALQQAQVKNPKT